MPLGPPERDGSTIGPARAGAAGVLGGAAAVGLVWVIAGRAPLPPAAPPITSPPVPTEQLTTPEPRPDPTETTTASTAEPPPAQPTPASGEPAPRELAPEGGPPPAAPTNTLALKVRLNHATREELDLLPGIGPVLAQRIIDDRARHGPFTSLLDFQRVPGIGEKKAADLAPHVRID